MSHPYVAEQFSASERKVLDRYFTNTDRPVFALKNLPEVVKGALFARYSRSAKSLRRLFLDEFYKGEGMGAGTADIGAERAAELYDRIFIEFGDDSVAQLGGAHIAVEQGSNILTKVLEWGRLAAYLEQSTRYVPYADKPGGRYRYYREPQLVQALGTRYTDGMDRIFDLYAGAVPKAIEAIGKRFPQNSDDPDRVYKATIRAKALDALRGMLPAATVSNTGIFATGQAYESMLLRMKASPLTEVKEVAAMMLEELDKVMDVFLQRVEQPNRGGVWVRYLEENQESIAKVAADLTGGMKADPAPRVKLIDFDPDAEEKLLAAMLYSSTSLPESQLLAKVSQLSPEERSRIVEAYVGDRRNRRHKPGRALERIDYRFDVLADYGAFRDLQRHRMLTLEWQDLSPIHGYEMPEEVSALGLDDAFGEAMEISGDLWHEVASELPKQAQYAVCMAYRIRFVMQLNAREAMHLIELRSSPQGHPGYRAVAHDMHRAIAQDANHPAVAQMMSFVDFSDVDLERLDAERKAERKRQQRQGDQP